MLQSMTGFGQARTNYKEILLAIDIRSVNSRYSEIITRCPRRFDLFEDIARKLISTLKIRGKITISLSIKNEAALSLSPEINMDLAHHYLKIGKELQEISGGTLEGLNLGQLFQLPDILLTREDDEDNKQLYEAIETCTKEALIQLEASRKIEGSNLSVMILDGLSKIEKLKLSIETLSVDQVKLAMEKMRKRIEEHIDKVNIEEQRLEQEIVFWGDRLDITEEIQRLTAHVSHFKHIVDEGKEAGKRLNFLLQEMLREANTIGSKTASYEVSHVVVELKNELERLREQIQNIQ
jgi:uncharacterized protein (TIGR00255 family)